MIKQMAQVNGISELTELVVLEDLNVLFAAVGVVGEVVDDVSSASPFHVIWLHSLCRLTNYRTLLLCLNHL